MSAFKNMRSTSAIKASEILDRVKNVGRAVAEDIKKEPTMAKIGLGMGATSLGLSLTNAAGNMRRNSQESKKLELEQKSISSLEKIHKALIKNQPSS